MTFKLILLTALSGRDLDRLTNAFGGGVEVAVVSTLEELENAATGAETTLLSFGSGVVVPRRILGRLAKPAYNLHAASPDFPGRDPHHHAVYRIADSYGATLHVMTAQVDAGSIVAVETFAVSEEDTPADLLARANELGLRMIERLGPRLLKNDPLPPFEDAAWGPLKTKREDLVRMSRITPLINEDEFERRYRAFDGGVHDNLALSLHGRTFRIDKQRPLPLRESSEFRDFTEAGYRNLLGQLTDGGYRFARYGEWGEDRHVIWRHDVDFSMHRAARLAEIESEYGAVATYFVNPRCAFYNLLEPGILALVDHIQSLGHEIGLHFDAAIQTVDTWTRDQLREALKSERALLESILNMTVRCVSWHNPDISNLLDFQDDEFGGMLNAYGERLRRDYAYCSDSNGHWRFKPMGEVIAEGRPRLHLLTHPAWWTAEAMSPSARIDRAIMGRARAVRHTYDQALSAAGRHNLD